MKFVDNWRRAWRWFSVQAFALIIALPLAWAALPPDVKEMMPNSWDKWIFVGLGAAGLLGRLIDQGPKATA